MFINTVIICWVVANEPVSEELLICYCLDSYLCACWVIMHAFLSSAEFFSKSTFSKNSPRNTIRVSNSLDPDQGRVFLGLISVQNVCKSYQQTTLVGKQLSLTIRLQQLGQCMRFCYLSYYHIFFLSYPQACKHANTAI